MENNIKLFRLQSVHWT